MKTIFAILILSAAAAGQSFIPCLENIAAPGVNDSVWYPGMAAPMPVHKPKWETRQTSDTAVYKLLGGHAWPVPVSMPAAGRCVGSFAAYDDREDAAVILTEAAGRYIPQKPAGEIEILLVDPVGFERFKANRSFVALWSSGRRVNGSFDISLAPGVYYFIINNRFSMLAAKSVTFTLGPAAL